MRRILSLSLMLAAATLASAVDDDSAAAWLGVVLGDAIDGGVQVVAVVPGGPAARAGLLRGDLLVAVADAVATDRGAVAEVLRSVEPGRRIAVRILRRGQLIERQVDTGRRPSLALGPAAALIRSGRRLDTLLGSRLVEMSPELRRHYGAPGDAGLLVAAVDPDGLAARAGLRVGDVVVRVCDVKVTGPYGVDPCAGRESGSVALEVVRERETTLLKADAPRSYAPPPRPEEGAATAVELRARWIEQEIERLRRRLAELEEELARLK